MPSIAAWLAYVFVAVGIIQHWLKQKEYIFSHDVIAAIANKHIPKAGEIVILINIILANF